MTKTNAMRILEKENINFNVIEYEDDAEKKLELNAANRLAEKLNLDPDSVFKTIVMRNEKKEIFVFCLSANNQVNLKKARNLTNSKEINSVKPEELLSLTGYIRGGCSPLGMKRNYPIFIDELALCSEKIYVSAGQRGLQLELAPEDLVKVSNATVCDLVL